MLYLTIMIYFVAMMMITFAFAIFSLAMMVNYFARLLNYLAWAEGGCFGAANPFLRAANLRKG